MEKEYNAGEVVELERCGAEGDGKEEFDYAAAAVGGLLLGSGRSCGGAGAT